MPDKKRVAGTVDRVEGDIAVVVIRDPDNEDCTKEIYVDKKKLKRIDLKEGDPVTVEYSIMEAEPKITVKPKPKKKPPTKRGKKA